MTADVNVIAHTFHFDVVHIKHFRELRGDCPQSMFQMRVLRELLAGFDGRGLAFNVGKDVRNFRNFLTNFRFEPTHMLVRNSQRHLLIHFQVLLNVKTTMQVLNAHIMHIQVVPRGDRAHPVKNIFRRTRTRDRANDHVSVGQDPMHRPGNFVGNLSGPLKSNATRKSYGDVGEALNFLPNSTSPRPSATTPLDQMSVEK